MILDKINAPPVLQSFLPNILGQFALNSLSGESIFKKITDNIAKFGKAAADGIGNVISFGQKVVEGVGSVTKAGFAKAVDFFSGIFDRRTQETLVRAGGGKIEEALLNNTVLTGQTARVQFDGVDITWNQAEDTLQVIEEERVSTYTGLSKAPTGDYLGQVAFAEEIADGIFLKQEYVPSDTNKITVSNLSKVETMEVAKDIFLKLADYSNQVFEGSQVGAGAGAKGKIKFGPIEVELGVEDLVVYRVTNEGIEQTTDSFSGIKIIFGNFQLKIDFENGEVELTGKANQGITLNQDFTVGVGGTTPNPFTGQAINAELKINMQKAVNLNELFERKES